MEERSLTDHLCVQNTINLGSIFSSRVLSDIAFSLYDYLILDDCTFVRSWTSNWNRSSLTDYSDHPRYYIAERSNPYDAHHEREGKPILETRFLAVRNCAHEYQVNRPRRDPSGLPQPSSMRRPDQELVLIIYIKYYVNPESDGRRFFTFVFSEDLRRNLAKRYQRGTKFNSRYRVRLFKYLIFDLWWVDCLGSFHLHVLKCTWPINWLPGEILRVASLVFAEYCRYVDKCARVSSIRAIMGIDLIR